MLVKCIAAYPSIFNRLRAIARLVGNCNFFPKPTRDLVMSRLPATYLYKLHFNFATAELEIIKFKLRFNLFWTVSKTVQHDANFAMNDNKINILLLFDAIFL